MLKSGPSRDGSASMELVRTPYFFCDPVRLGAIACVVLLMLVKEPPMALALFAIGLSQLNGVAMVVHLIGRGWSEKWGRRVRGAVVTNSMAMDWTNMNVCTLIGAMLLMRIFGKAEVTHDLVTALGLLALGLSLVPDMRLCRLIMPGDPTQASKSLEHGWFFRDPMKLGGLAALVIISVMDHTSLSFILLSMLFMQFNSVLLLVDKYLGELEASPAARRYRSLTLRLVMARDGQRLLVTLLPLVFVALRLTVDGATARWAGLAVAGVIVLPDALRLAWRLVSGLWGFGAQGSDTRRLKTVRNVNLGGV